MNWKRVLKIAGIVVGSLVVLVVGVGYMLPDTFRCERSIVIDASTETVFDLVSDVEKMQQWNPWKMKDPTLETTFGPDKTGVGAWYEWRGDHSGNGRATIAELVTNERVRTDLDFRHQGQGVANIRLTPKGDEVEVVWDFEGKSPGPMGRWFGLMIDALLGPSYENGLEKLKEVAEKAPRPAATPQPAPEPTDGGEAQPAVEPG